MSNTDVERLVPLAAALGVAWANECAVDLRTAERDVVGAWPGTVREARSRVLSIVRTSARPKDVDAEALELLARAAYEAARKSWRELSEPDPEI
jgi:hypothetical protein